MNKMLASLSVALTVVAAAGQAANAGVSFSLNLGPLSVVSTPACLPPPPVCRPAPPVVFVPPPVIVRPVPVVCAPAVVARPVPVWTAAPAWRGPIHVPRPPHRYHGWYAVTR